MAGVLSTEIDVTTDAFGGATYTPFSFLKKGPPFQASADGLTSGSIPIAC